MHCVAASPHRPLRRFFAPLTCALLAFWMVLLVAEVDAPLHRWLHGGAIPNDDSCAVAQLSHGQIKATAVALFIGFAAIVLYISRCAFLTPFVFQLPLPPGRGPPAFASAH